MLVAFWAARPALYMLPRALRVTRRAYSTPLNEASVPKVKKVWDDIDDAVKAIKSGDTLLSGGAPNFAKRLCSL